MPITDPSGNPTGDPKAIEATARAYEALAKAYQTLEDSAESYRKVLLQDISDQAKAVDALKKREEAGENVTKQMVAARSKLAELLQSQERLSESTKKSSDSTREYGEQLSRTVANMSSYLQGAVALVKVNVDYKLSIQATTDAIYQHGKATAGQIATMQTMRQNLLMTREEFQKFATTLRMGAEFGIDPKKIEEVTKKLQALYGVDQGRQMATRLVAAERTSPGAISAVMSGDQKRVEAATRGQDMETKDAIRAAARAQSGETGGKDAKFSQDLAKNNQTLDNIKSEIAEIGQKYLGPIVAVQGVAMVAGISSIVVQLVMANRFLAVIATKSAAGGGGIGIGGGGAAAAGGSRLGRFAGGAARIGAGVAGYAATSYLTSKMMGDDANPLLKEGANIGGSIVAERGVNALVNRGATQAGTAAAEAATKAAAEAAAKTAATTGTQAATGGMRALAGGALKGLGGGAGIAGIGGLGVNIVGSYFEGQKRSEAEALRAEGRYKEAQGKDRTASQIGGVAALGGVASMAGTGAAIGSFIPVIGTAIGATVGAAIGVVMEKDRLKEGYKATFMAKDSVFQTTGVGKAAYLALGGAILEVTGIAKGWRDEMEHAEKITAILSKSTENQTKALLTSIPSIEAFQQQMAAAAQQAELSKAVMYGSNEGALVTNRLARGGAGAGDIRQSMDTQFRGQQERFASINRSLGEGSGSFVGRLTSLEGERQSLRKQSEENLAQQQKALDNVVARREAMAKDLREGKIKGTFGGTYTNFDDYEPYKKLGEEEKAQRKAMEGNKNTLKATGVGGEYDNKIQDLVLSYSKSLSEYLDRIKEVSIGKMHQMSAEGLQIRLGPFKDMEAAQAGLLGIIGTINGDAGRAADLFKKRLEIAQEEQDTYSKEGIQLQEAHGQRMNALKSEKENAQKALEAMAKSAGGMDKLKNQYRVTRDGKETIVGGDQLTAEEKKSATSLYDALNQQIKGIEAEMKAQDMESKKAWSDYQKKMVESIQAQHKAAIDAMTSIRNRLQGSAAFRISMVQEESQNATLERQRAGGASAAQVQAATGETARLAKERADALEKGLPETQARIKETSQREIEMSKRREENARKELEQLDKMAPADSPEEKLRRQQMRQDIQGRIGAEGDLRKDAETRAQEEATRAAIDAEKARTHAIKEATRAATEAGEVEKRRIQTSRAVTESQRGVAEYLGMSYATQLSLQKDILKTKVDEKRVVQDQMKNMEGQFTEDQLKNNQTYQDLVKQNATMSADIIKSSVGIQRDFMDKALGKAFGVGAGSKFQPGMGNANFMKKKMFGEFMEVGGMTIAGQVNLDQQRAEMAKVAGMEGMEGRPVGPARMGAVAAVNPRFGAGPGGKGQPGGAAPAVNAARPAAPAGGAAAGGEAVDISGKVQINVDFNREALKVNVREVVLQMVRSGELVRGHRGGV